MSIMHEKSEAVKQARRELIQQTLDKIIETQDFSELKNTTYVVLAHLWFHKIAEQENLFKLEEWLNFEGSERILTDQQSHIILKAQSEYG